VTTIRYEQEGGAGKTVAMTDSEPAVAQKHPATEGGSWSPDAVADPILSRTLMLIRELFDAASVFIAVRGEWQPGIAGLVGARPDPAILAALPYDYDGTAPSQAVPIPSPPSPGLDCEHHTPGLVAGLAAPLPTEPGFAAAGVLCVLGNSRCSYTTDERLRLSDFAALLAGHLKPPLHRQDASQDRRALSRQKAFLDSTLASIDQGLVMIDSDGTVVVANRRAEEILGLPADYLASRPHYTEVRRRLLEQGEYEGTSEEFRSWVSSGELFPNMSVYERRRPSGEVIEVQTVTTAEGGTVRIYTDITARREAERAVRKSEALYRLLAENATDMIVRIGLDGVRRYVSPASREITGYEPEELLGGHIIGSVHPDERAMAQEALERFRRGETERQIVTFRVRRKDDRYIWVESRRRLVRGTDGEPIEIVAVVRDISIRKAVEDALHASEARYRLLAESTSDMIMLQRSSREQTYISPAVQQVLGHPPEYFTSRSIADAIHPDNRERVEALFESLGPANSTGLSVHRMRHAQGHDVWVEVLYRWTRADDGSPIVIASGRDVTERQRQAEELQAAKEAAEQASEAKTQFLATMSHEIRTPLNGVLGHADLLLEDRTLAPAHRRHLERIQSAGDALLTIVNDILDLSRIEAGRIDLDPRPFAIRNLVDNVFAIVRQLAERKGLLLDFAIDARIPARVIGDESRLRQILLNLLNNAIKFTATGRVCLFVDWTGSADGPDRIVFRVEDTGIGIPAEKQALIFDRFSQVDSTTSREFGGTGLGLAISRRLVELMAGTIAVESTPGRGTVFSFSVVLPAAHEGEIGTSTDPSAEFQPNSSRILLVEDNDINQEIAAAVLRRAGFTVTVASGGQEALGALEAEPEGFDLVLMDMQMPGMDGLTATRRIRELPGRAGRIPIIAMTANVLPAQVQACREAGMNDHIGKPFRRAELLAALGRWLPAEQGTVP
jgi:PAS domain S-box-containing protein